MRQEGLGRGASFVDKGLNEWIASMTRAEREGFVETLFSVLNAAGEDTFADLSGNWQASVPAMLKRSVSLSPSGAVTSRGRSFFLPRRSCPTSSCPSSRASSSPSSPT